MLHGWSRNLGRKRTQGDPLATLRKRYQSDANTSTLVLALRHGHANLVARALPDMLLVSEAQAAELENWPVLSA
jgi:hypothetical protein